MCVWDGNDAWVYISERASTSQVCWTLTITGTSRDIAGDTYGYNLRVPFVSAPLGRLLLRRLKLLV